MTGASGRNHLLAFLDRGEPERFGLDARTRRRVAAAFDSIPWAPEVDTVAATPAGLHALVRGVAFGFDRHGPAVVDAIVRDHIEPVPDRRISDHQNLAAEVTAARAFLIAEFGRIRGRAMELMFEAVDVAIDEGRPLTLSERNFLDHELLEARHVANGWSQRDAHLKVHETIPPGANFSPHILVELHEYFGPENFRYWGLRK